MEKPVTINLDQEVLERALRLAEEKHKSLSEIVSELLSDFVRNEGRTKEELLSIIHEMAGSYGPLKEDIDSKSERHKYLDEKYLEVKAS